MAVISQHSSNNKWVWIMDLLHQPTHPPTHPPTFLNSSSSSSSALHHHEKELTYWAKFPSVSRGSVVKCKDALHRALRYDGKKANLYIKTIACPLYFTLCPGNSLRAGNSWNNHPPLVGTPHSLGIPSTSTTPHSWGSPGELLTPQAFPQPNLRNSSLLGCSLATLHS
jgi:hypothetical protein